jgi:hypothetical protein
MPRLERKAMGAVANEVTEKQVLLRRRSPSGGFFEDVFWIDADKARKGAHVIDELDRTWVVAEVYGSRTSKDQQLTHGDRKRFGWVLGE